MKKRTRNAGILAVVLIVLGVAGAIFLAPEFARKPLHKSAERSQSGRLSETSTPGSQAKDFEAAVREDVLKIPRQRRGGGSIRPPRLESEGEKDQAEESETAGVTDEEEEPEGVLVVEPWEEFSVRVRVVTEAGVPVEGAFVNIVPAKENRHGLLEIPGSNFPVGRPEVGGLSTTDASGIVVFKSACPPHTPPDATYAVLGFHPNHGVGYEFFSLGALRSPSAGQVNVRLIRGDVVVGRVIDNHGDPVSGARVAVFLSTGPSTLHLGQLNGVSDEEGRFRVSGILPDSRPHLVLAEVALEYAPPDFGGRLPPLGDPSYPKWVISDTKGVKDEMYDPATGEWRVGELVIDWEKGPPEPHELPEESGGRRRQRARRR